MTDVHDNGTLARPFDDDRLLACALGLDDDPELVAAAEHDAGLGRRLEQVRADVAAVGAGVQRAVPAPDESYTDLRDPRWAALREQLRVPGPAATRSRGSRWLRVLAPVAVAVAALAVGLTLVVDHQGGSSTSTTSEGAKAQLGQAEKQEAPGVAAPHALTVAEEAHQFATVVIARARAVEGSLQTFSLVRILKGSAPAVFKLHVAQHPADVGALHIVFIRPLRAAAEMLPDELAYGSATHPRARVDEISGEPIAFRYAGATAVTRALAPGTDPATVKLH